MDFCRVTGTLVATRLQLRVEGQGGSESDVHIRYTVTPLGDGRSRWTARGPGDIPLSWEAEIVADEPGRLIAWRSVEGAEVDNAGSVRFTPAPGGRGTEVKVLLSYAPPAGRLGTAVATVLGRSGDQQVREDLRRFKQRMEADEVATAARRHAEAW